MKKWSGFVWMLSLVVILMAIVSHSESWLEASETKMGPSKIILKMELGGRVLQKMFTHQGHVEEYNTGCQVCHHVFENDQNVWEMGMPVQKCVACHTPDSLQMEEELIPGYLLKELMTHESCKDCHKKS